MQSLDLIEAATFLKMNAEVLRRKAKAGDIPSRKIGKRWVFIREHLADFVSGRYAQHGRELRVIDGFKHIHEDKQCQSTNAKKRGGLSSPHQTADEYNNLLGLK
jgi:hypothetical protein